MTYNRACLVWFDVSSSKTAGCVSFSTQYKNIWFQLYQRKQQMRNSRENEHNWGLTKRSNNKWEKKNKNIDLNTTHKAATQEQRNCWFLIFYK